MKKRLLSIVTTLAVLLTMFPVSALAANGADIELPEVPGQRSKEWCEHHSSEAGDPPCYDAGKRICDCVDCDAAEALAERQKESDEGGSNDEDVVLEVVELDPIETSVPDFNSGIQAFTLDSTTGNVALKGDGKPNWIDRIDIPKYAKDFYTWMEDNSVMSQYC